MCGVADRRRDDLGGDPTGSEALDDLGENLARVDGDVVEPAHEAGNVGGACAGSQERLVGAEDEGHVDWDPLGRKRVGGLQALLAEGHLHGHVLVKLAQRAPLRDHAGRVLRDDLGRDRTADEVADPLDDVPRIAVLLRQQRWIGGRPGQDAPARDLLHLGDAPGVNEKAQTHSLAARLISCV